MEGLAIFIQFSLCFLFQKSPKQNLLFQDGTTLLVERGPKEQLFSSFPWILETLFPILQLSSLTRSHYHDTSVVIISSSVEGQLFSCNCGCELEFLVAALVTKKIRREEEVGLTICVGSYRLGRKMFLYHLFLLMNYDDYDLSPEIKPEINLSITSAARALVTYKISLNIFQIIIIFTFSLLTIA